MFRAVKTLAAGLLAVALAGCSNSAPSDYAQQRPDVNQLSPDDSGLQSKDVVAATDQLVADLCASPKLNASQTQWTLAVSGVQDMTTDRMFSTNYDIFTESLRAAIADKAQGRIQLIENKATFEGLRNQEIEGGNPDPYQQGGNPNPPAPAGAINPDYILYGKAIDMPNRSTNFYFLEFTIVNTHTRTQDWVGKYEIKVAR
jgi:hypothetical protein